MKPTGRTPIYARPVLQKQSGKPWSVTAFAGSAALYFPVDHAHGIVRPAAQIANVIRTDAASAQDHIVRLAAQTPANAAAENMSLNPAGRYIVSAARRSPYAKPSFRTSANTTQQTATDLMRTRRPCAPTERSVLYAAMYLTQIRQPLPVRRPAPRNYESNVRKKRISGAESGNHRSA